uniref:Reverse transcriptase domain-containing protein n=1 Tax=Cannabis sativa TaxID=3483 RepID=A0A803P3Q4_CANSA
MLQITCRVGTPEKLFTAQEEDHWALSHVLSTIPTTINDDHNEFHLRDFTKEDVFFALKSMASDKSPGLDGMSVMFYHHHWHIVGDLVSSVVLHLLNENGDPTVFNKTLLTFIPKVKKPNSMKDFRPISLCNVVYKLISKMIVFRFKDVLPHVLSKTQSAFLPNRLITDNVLIAFEMIHSLKHRKKGSKGYATIKLDMSRAFDRVEWSFLAAVMGSITPQRGLRQGDPLSPYLFLICSEGLSRLLQYEENIGRLKGYVVSRRAPMISHLFFADDSLLFCQADDRSCGVIKRALDIYHRASGQELNLDKSVMSFSPNTPATVQSSFQNILGMPISECHEKYLGLPGRWIWHFTGTSEYSVQTRYHFATDLEDSELSTPSTNQHTWWKYFWNLKLPSKVKIFAWKAFHQAIPTAASLCNRKIIDSAACSLCSNAYEFVEHAMFLCKHAKKVWQSAGISFDYDMVSKMKFNDCLVLLSTLKTTSEMEQMLCTMWFLWNDRNNFIHGKPVLSPSQIWAKSAAYFCNYQQHSSPPHNSIKASTGAAANPKWQHPPLHDFEMNVDAACDVSRNKIGVGIIIRNSSRQVVAACSKPLTVNSINSRSAAISYFGDLVLDIKNHLSYLSSVCVSHVKRDANQAAHGLAKQTLVLDDDCIWFEEIPSTICFVVVNDSL